MAMYRNSFRELQVDYIDYLLLHGVSMGSGMEEFEARYIDNGMLDFLLAEREAGRIHNLGFSYHGDIAVFDHLLAQHDRYSGTSCRYSSTTWTGNTPRRSTRANTDAEYLYGELEKRGIPAVIMEPLLGGRLSNVHDHRRPSQTAAPVVERRFVGVPFRGVVPRGADRAERHDLHGAFAGQPAYLLAARRADRCRQGVSRGDGAAVAPLPTIPCNDCKYCMPCPYGLDIPAILLHYNKCVNEGNVATSSQDENYRQARRAFLVRLRPQRPPNSARPAIASAVTSACRIARRISVSRRNCTASTGSPNISNRIAYRPSGPFRPAGFFRLLSSCAPCRCGMPLADVVYPVCLPNAARPLLPGIPQQSLRR